MFHRIAVVYRGHMRTWNYVKQVNFDFFESISKHVDYYFVTWNLPFTNISIEEDFKNKNLVKFLRADIDNEFYGPDFGPPFLLNEILPYKKEREKIVRYDFVVDIRPDIILKMWNEKEFPIIKKNDLYVQWEGLCWTPDYDYEVPGIGDICNFMSSEVFDVVSQRYKQKYNLKELCHVNNRNYCIEKNLNIKIFSNFCRAIQIRPQMLEYFKNANDIFKISLDEETVYKNHWICLSKEEKIRILNKFDILLEDYGEFQHGVTNIRKPKNHEKLDQLKLILSKTLNNLPHKPEEHEPLSRE